MTKRVVAVEIQNKQDSVNSGMFKEKYPFPLYFYIISNQNKTVLYCGITNNLETRLSEHANSEGNRETFAGRYNCHYLVFYEGFDSVTDAIRRRGGKKVEQAEKRTTYQFFESRVEIFE